MRRGYWAWLACSLVLCVILPAHAQTGAADVPPPAEATLDQDRLPTAGEHATLLHVVHPGRFAIKAESPTGTALQLVDMLTGPSDLAGEAGAADGRIDQLLDAGIYKLRLFGAENAQGETHLTVIPFRDRGPPVPAPPATGEAVAADLADLQQRSYRMIVGTPGRVRIEAAGRSLRDLRLWREGTDLVPIEAVARTVEPIRGHPLADLSLEGAIEPGRYLITAYGGPPLAWADGGSAQPLYLRIGSAPTLADGWVRDTIGPFGSMIYEVGPHETSLRLDLADPAPVQLSVRADNRVLGEAVIAKNSREPHATVSLPVAEAGVKRLVQVSGSQGQEFRLRGFRLSGSRSLVTPGTWWLSAETIGAGGDELPATALLLREDPAHAVVPVGGSAPRIGPGQAWRWRFNLRGASSLLFEVTDGGPVAVRADGVAVVASVATVGGAQFARRSDGTAPAEWDLATGWYVLRLTPVDGASGPLDLTLGPPGLVPDRPSAPQPPAPVIAFGRQTVSPGQRLNLVSGDGPGVAVALSARTLPVDLEAAPLSVTLAAQEALELPIRLPTTGRLAATVIGEGAATVELGDPREVAGKLVGTARIAASDRIHTVILAWHAPVVTANAPPPVLSAPEAALDPGRPRFFDLGRDQRRSFAFAVGQGGLYRVETTGRLKTEGWIGTPFIAEIDHQTANGHGQNMLLQSYLRAGRYRVTVAAKDSAGRAGILARPAPLLDGAALVPGGSVRAALPAGSGAAFPIEIADKGNYHLDLKGLGRGFTARLEDEEGWPILPAGDLSSLDRALSPGRYRLLVLPLAVDARVIARLARVEPKPVLEGHGPHRLPFEVKQHYQWREPLGRDDPRPPDQWEFALEGPAHVTIEISDGMVADLRRADAAAGAAGLARLVYKSGFAGELPAGSYRVEASSLGRNDRLDYWISLKSDELQPGRPRSVTVPVTVPFAIARDRVVSLTSFGNVDVKAVLRDGEGHVVGRFDDRVDDWNIAVSRHLRAGHYTLDLSKVAPAPAKGAQPAQDDSGDQEEDSDQSTADQSTDQSTAEPADQPQNGELTEAAAETADEHVELRLVLPQEAETVAVPASGVAKLRGAEVHRLALPQVPAGELMVAAAASTAELTLALERQGPDGSWHSVGLDQGLAPVVAVPADADTARKWRVSLWTVDGGAEAATFAFRGVPAAAQPVGPVALAPLTLEGMTDRLSAGVVAAPAAGLLRLHGDSAGVVAGSAMGEALRPIEGGVIVPQSDRVWLMTRGREAAKVDLAALAPAAGQSIALSLPQGGVATLPTVPAASGKLRFWLAKSGVGQPAVTAGSGMGVAPGTAFAIAGPAAVKAWNAGGEDGLRLRLETGELSLLPERRIDAAFSGTVPARSAVPLRLAAGNKRLRLDLPAGAAAIAGWQSIDAVTAWTGGAPASWVLEGGWDQVLLANPGKPLPIAASVSPLTGPPGVLRPGVAEKRFFGAAGTLSLSFEARPGTRLVVAGAAATVVTAEGRVRRGGVIPLSGPGRVVLQHPPGLVAAWIEGDGVSPWPPAAPKPVTMPAQLALAGDTMTLVLPTSTPALLHARTTAPVIVILRRGDADEAPVLFPAGAEFHRYLASGAAQLRLISPHDGPLSGSLELDTTPVTPAAEGLGDAVAVAPGGTALFAFDVVRDGAVGVGIRADPDQVAVRLLGEDGATLGTGVAMLRRLHPGHYLIEARMPADAETALVQPAVVGITPRPNGPPAEVVRKYLELVGMVPTNAH